MASEDLYEIRVKNLLRLIEQYKTQEALQGLTGIASSTFSRIKRGPPGANNLHSKRMGENLARRIEESLDLPDFWMDIDHSATPSPNVPRIRLVAREIPKSSSLRGAPSKLTSIQAATHDTLVKLMLGGKLPDTACLKLLQAWQSDIEELDARPGISS